MIIYFQLSLWFPLWYGMILNTLKNGGYWGYMKNKNNQREMNERAKSIKVFIKQQIAKY